MKNDKYNKKLKYRKNPYLTDNIDLKSFFNIAGLMVIAISLLTLFDVGSYSILSKSIDFTSAVLLVLYIFIIRPFIYSGKVKAYYRRNYDTVSIFNGLFLRLVSIFASRLAIISFFKIITIKDVFYPITGIWHPVGVPSIFLIFTLMIYFTFFNDKYTTIKEFSNKVNYEMLANKRNLGDAIMFFYKEKDKEYNVKEFDGTYYDYENAENIKKESKRDDITIRREMREENDRSFMDEKNNRRL